MSDFQFRIYLIKNIYHPDQIRNRKFEFRNQTFIFAAHLTLFAAVSMDIWKDITHYYTIVIQQ